MSDISVETPEAAAARFVSSLFKPSHILVALSGGGDSLGLLMAIAEAIRAQGRRHRLSAATVDHGLRAESADEVRDVAALCAGLNIPHLSRRWEGEKPQSGLMAAAREARYELLAEMAAEARADLVVTGHTFDDQQETLTMRGARLGSASGLPVRGIADATLFERKLWVLRPFLNCRREDIRHFLVVRGATWIDDPSNENMKFERVRVRTTLRNSSERAPSADLEASMRLSSEAATWLDRYVRIHCGVVCDIRREALGAKHEVVTYALGCLAAVFGGQPYGLGSQAVARVLEFLRRGEVGRRTAGGVVFDLRRDNLYVVRENRNIAPLLLPPDGRGIWDGRFEVFNGTSIPVRIVAGAPSSPVERLTELPRGIIQRVHASGPVVETDGNASPAVEKVAFSPRFAPFDRFLTRFDFTFADRLAAGFERMPYLSPPL